jgi:DNA-binding LytR/AlgR family response regulator
MNIETLIPVGGRMKFAPSDIVLLESDINYTRLHFSDGTSVITSLNLGKLEPLFALHSFYRVHRRFMINMSYATVRRVRKSLLVRLPNNHEILVAKRKKKSFASYMKQAV